MKSTDSRGRPLEDREDNEPKKRPRKQLKLWDVPSSHNYAVSFMHRSTITHVVSSNRHGYVLTASEDGVVKFWKRLSTEDSFRKEDPSEVINIKKENMTTPCLEFVKSFTAHVGAVIALCMAPNGDTATSVGVDNVVKVYDIPTFDVTGMVKTHVQLRGPTATMTNEWLAVPDDQNQIQIYSWTTLSAEPIKTLSLHAKPITAMTLNKANNCIMSADESGIVELWDASDFGSSITNTSYSSKTDTDYYVLMKKKTHAVALATSGTHYCAYGHDGKVRIYHHATGKIVCRMDERPRVYQETFAQYGMDALEYGKRAATEREIQQESSILGSNSTEGQQQQRLSVDFDPTGQYVLLPTLVGIKIVDWARRKLVGVIGKSDATTLRFVHFCLCPGDAKVNRQIQLARAGGSNRAVADDEGQEKASDAHVVGLAYNKRRLFVFAHKDPVQESLDRDEEDDHNEILTRRDVWNEAPDADDRLAALEGGVNDEESKLGREAILRTTMGDIHIKLFTNQVPRTIENFCGHARSGYYDKVIFHRVIKGFMIQTGDPLGDGTGGESIWGGEFEDEFVRDLRHDRPFTVSMANAGPNTNGSQFFITTVPTPWLDNKHTVFGRVTRGMDICSSIEKVETDHNDKPFKEISIESIDIVA